MVGAMAILSLMILVFVLASYRSLIHINLPWGSGRSVTFTVHHGAMALGAVDGFPPRWHPAPITVRPAGAALPNADVYGRARLPDPASPSHPWDAGLFSGLGECRYGYPLLSQETGPSYSADGRALAMPFWLIFPALMTAPLLRWHFARAQRPQPR